MRIIICGGRRRVRFERRRRDRELLGKDVGGQRDLNGGGGGGAGHDGHRDVLFGIAAEHDQELVGPGRDAELIFAVEIGVFDLACRARAGQLDRDPGVARGGGARFVRVGGLATWRLWSLGHRSRAGRRERGLTTSACFALYERFEIRVRVDRGRVVLHQAAGIRGGAIVAVQVATPHP